MRSFCKSISCLMLVFVVSACAGGIEKVGPGTFKVQKNYEVTLGMAWSAFPFNARTNIQELTIDGTSLNVLVFGAGIEDGDPLIYSSDPTKLVPRFSTEMSDGEVAEFIADSLRFNGFRNLILDDIRPEMFGELNGIRFDFAADTQLGLNMSGTGKATVHNNALEFILYTAPSEYYYGLHELEAERVLESVTLIQSASG